jgi:hypothetical protein
MTFTSLLYTGPAVVGMPEPAHAFRCNVRRLGSRAEKIEARMCASITVILRFPIKAEAQTVLA